MAGLEWSVDDARIESMQPGDDRYDAKFIVPDEYVNEHIVEEQNEMSPKTWSRQYRAKHELGRQYDADFLS